MAEGDGKTGTLSSGWIAFWVALGGGIGASLRHGVDQLLMPWVTTGTIPVFSATLTVNLLGSLLIGIAAVITAPRRWDGQHPGGPALRAFIITGFLGGMTTVSLFSLELLWHLQIGQYGLAMAYLAATLLFCPLAVWLGYRLARGRVLRQLHRRRRLSP